MTTAIEPYTYRDYYLQHYGVKGMRWGVRKKKQPWTPENRNENLTDDQVKDARQTFGKRGAQRVSNRMNKGQSYNRAFVSETINSQAKAFVSVYGGLAITKVAINVATNPETQAKILKGAEAAGKFFRDVDPDNALSYAKLAKRGAKGVYNITTLR